MLYIIVILAGASAGLLALALSSAVFGGKARAISDRLATLDVGAGGYTERKERRRRQAKRDRVEALLTSLGERISEAREDRTDLRRRMDRAGFRHPRAVALYLASRVVAAGLFGTAALLLAPVSGANLGRAVLVVAAGAILGWLLPALYVRWRTKKRQKEIGRYLPDALDLMVVCVEAGLGTNQTILRVGEEMDRLSPALGDELTFVSLEVGAGTPREEALRNLAERTGLREVRSLTSLLIQTDRFGTSVADALRIHAAEMRDKRRQEAEEDAAKMSIKMLFPLVLFIFPALFVVILGPAVFHLSGMFGSM